MVKQYISVFDAIEKWKFHLFVLVSSYNGEQHPVAKKMLDLRHLRIYQERRFYLDEFPEQKKLREEYFALKRASYNFTVNNNETYWFESRFLTKK